VSTHFCGWCGSIVMKLNTYRIPPDTEMLVLRCETCGVHNIWTPESGDGLQDLPANVLPVPRPVVDATD